jgi:type II secretory pathway pseudopilin PulG
MAGPAPKLSVIKNKKRQQLRTTNGAYLLELLVAMFVSGMMALALTTSLTQGMSSSRGSQNQVLATWLAQQAMERIKMSADQSNSSAFSTFNGIFEVNSPATVQFKLTSNDPISVQPYDFLQRPLMFDFSSLKWNSEDSTETSPKTFSGTVQALIEDRADAGGKNIQITVTWTDTNGTGQKQYMIKGAVFKQ